MPSIANETAQFFFNVDCLLLINLFFFPSAFVYMFFRMQQTQYIIFRLVIPRHNTTNKFGDFCNFSHTFGIAGVCGDS